MSQNTATPAVAGSSAPEDVFYYILPEWYKGNEPPFYDPKQLPTTRILEDNFNVIKAEIDEVFARGTDLLRPNFTPYAYREEGWKTINLLTYFLEYPKSIALFPETYRIVKTIPNLCMAQIAVLDPRTRIKAHFGDTSALIRSHMGIRVPGTLPDIGIRVGREERGWEEGRVFAIQIAHRHFAWNNTDEHRIALVIDVVRDEYVGRKYEVASKALAAIFMKAIATRFPRLKKLPKPLVRVMHPTLAALIRTRLFVQRHLGL